MEIEYPIMEISCENHGILVFIFCENPEFI